MRDALVRTRTGDIAVIRALLRQHGWRVSTGSAEGFSRRVLAIPISRIASTTTGFTRSAGSGHLRGHPAI